MASLKTIRNRIRSVKSTQQITRAMKMVAAARLRRAQEAVLASRPYAQKMEEVLKGVALRADIAAHPLLAKRAVKKAEIVVLTSDRGLCGGFNGNITRSVQRFIVENSKHYEKITLRTIGRKGNEYFKRRSIEIRKDHAGFLHKPNYEMAQALSEELIALFLSGEVDSVYLAYNEFVSPVSQVARFVQLLPMSSPPIAERSTVVPTEYLFEPSAEDVLHDLLPRNVAYQVWRAILESIASEHGARMSAMDNATNNAAEMIGRLTLQYNRTRQAGITKELMEIVSGAEAQK